jgi:hypothetical protein
MGAGRLVTVPALDVFGEMRREIVDGANAGEIQPYRASRLAGLLIRLDDRLRFAHNRLGVIRLATGDVVDARNVEEKCLKAYIHPLTFDLGPDEAA